MQTCHFSSKEALTFSDDKRWRADGENQLFPIRKATLLIWQVPAMLCQPLSGLRELARVRPICCTCYFPATTNHISWPCAPLRDETSARRNGAARGSLRKTIVFELGKSTFRATGPPCRSVVLESLRLSISEKVVFNQALWSLHCCCASCWPMSCRHWPPLSRIESFKYFHLPNHFAQLPSHTEVSFWGVEVFE